MQIINSIGNATSETAASIKSKLGLTSETVTGFLDNTGEISNPTVSAPTTLELGTALTVNGTFKGITMTATVDTNAVGVGALLAIGTDGNFDEADADAIANCYMLAIATATGTGAKTLLLQGQICNTDWTWDVGLPIYASITQGTLSQTIVSGTDDVNVMIGFALSADTIYFNPYLAYVTKT